MNPRKAFHARAVEKAKELERQGVRIAMTAVTRLELHAGIEQAQRRAEEGDLVSRAIRAFPAWALTDRLRIAGGSFMEGCWPAAPPSACSTR